MAIMTKAFRWTDAYSVHIDALDRQHQRLFATVEELNEALAEGKGNEALDPILQKLVEYAVTHFAAEEGLMKRHEFPGLAEHQAEHEKFRLKVADSMKEHRANKCGVPVTLMLFLQSWLKQHVQQVDKEYSAYLNARGIH